MEGSEVRKLAALEDEHWWYRERRHLVARGVAGLRPGRALDVGAAGGGNTRVLRDLGWDAVALEYGADGAEVATGRGLPTVRGDAVALPLADASTDLVVSFDVLEHLVDDLRSVEEMHRVLRPGGVLLVAVPCDPRLWSAHDVAVDHVRRYTRAGLRELLEAGGFAVDAMDSWNVLLRPLVRMHRRASTGSDLQTLHPAVNLGLRGLIVAERYLPVQSLPGVSLMVRARRP